MQDLVGQCLKAMWREYVATKEPRLRDCLVEYYLDRGIVRRAAKKLAQSLPGHVELSELNSAGETGLLTAMERFDPSRNVKFETFCAPVVRGAMLDFLREIDPLSRHMRKSVTELSAATEELRSAHGRAPSDAELCKKLNISQQKLRKTVSHSLSAASISLNHRPTTGEGRSAPLDVLTANQLNADFLVQRNDVRDWVTRGLATRDRLIIVLYYYESMTMREIGDTLGMSESRVSQIHKRLLKLLSTRVRRQPDELVALSA